MQKKTCSAEDTAVTTVMSKRIREKATTAFSYNNQLQQSAEQLCRRYNRI